MAVSAANPSEAKEKATAVRSQGVSGAGPSLFYPSFVEVPSRDEKGIVMAKKMIFSKKTYKAYTRESADKILDEMIAKNKALDSKPPKLVKCEHCGQVVPESAICCDVSDEVRDNREAEITAAEGGR